MIGGPRTVARAGNVGPVNEMRPMRRHAHALSLALFVLLQGTGALAHHSFAAEFDAQKPVTLKGAVVLWEMINPHGWITLAVTAPDGSTTQWMVETSNPNGLMRLGWTKNSLKPGDQITVEGYLAKDGSSTANAARITLSDGSKVFAGSPTTPQ
jgi:hypothetical protein